MTEKVLQGLCALHHSSHILFLQELYNHMSHLIDFCTSLLFIISSLPHENCVVCHLLTVVMHGLFVVPFFNGASLTSRVSYNRFWCARPQNSGLRTINREYFGTAR